MTIGVKESAKQLGQVFIEINKDPIRSARQA